MQSARTPESRPVSGRGPRHRSSRSRRPGRGVRIADRGEFGPLGMPGDGLEVVLRDATTADDGESDLAAGDRRASDVHGRWGSKTREDSQSRQTRAPVAASASASKAAFTSTKLPLADDLAADFVDGQLQKGLVRDRGDDRIGARQRSQGSRRTPYSRSASSASASGRARTPRRRSSAARG